MLRIDSPTSTLYREQNMIQAKCIITLGQSKEQFSVRQKELFPNEFVEFVKEILLFPKI